MRFKPHFLVAALIIFSVATVLADPIRILPLGDSITEGGRKVRPEFTPVRDHLAEWMKGYAHPPDIVLIHLRTNDQSAADKATNDAEKHDLFQKAITDPLADIPLRLARGPARRAPADETPAANVPSLGTPST
jgi:hypothetical protein